ncbi:MAG TPA: FixH family protein [Candidatus Syntrophosphaera sp.]|jgi:hypothetical protein|nr:FixH family protein [Candidatus Syntrophosphaera sp.]
MKSAITLLLAIIALLPIALNAQCENCQNHQMVGNQKANAGTKTIVKHIFTSQNKNYWVSEDKYISYKWQSKPKIGTNMLLVTVYSKGKKINNDLILTANSYMPSMRGAHDTGDQPMMVNKKKTYVIPVNLVMLGDWEVELNFRQNGKIIYTGYIQLNL